MVDWGWIIMAFLTGFYTAFIVYGCIAARGQDARCEECYRRKVDSTSGLCDLDEEHNVELHG
jgi:hypothetical protein